MDTEYTKEIIRVLSERAAEREQELSQHESGCANESDEELDGECPILDSFYFADGNQSIIQITNFSSKEFRGIWNRFRNHVIPNWNIVRGLKSSFKARDVFFMSLADSKHGDNRIFSARCLT